MARVTVLDVDVRLANGTLKAYRWTTPLTIGRAMARGRQWAIHELRKEKIPGRSQIVGLRVEARVR